MRVIYLLHSCSGASGGARIVFEHTLRLQARGHDAMIATLDGSTSVGWYPAQDLKVIERTQLEAMARKADVVVATEANTAPVVMNLETEARKYYFIQMRESLFFLMGNPPWAGNVEENYRKAKGILQPVVISQWLKDFLEDEYGYENVPMVPNGVNTAHFYPDPQFPRSEGKKRVLIEGFASSEAKDVRMMSYKAVEKYMAEHPGEIELWGFSQMGCYGTLFDRYFRYPNQDLIRQIYSSCDVLLKASVHEGRSCVGPECMACGGAAICRAITLGHGDDDLRGGENCLKVAYGDFQGFYTNFVRLLEDDALRERLVANGLRYVKERLDWGDKVDLLEEVYAGG